MSRSTSPHPADHPIERSADHFLEAPAGQALLAVVDASDLTPADLADPELAAHVVTTAMHLVRPFGATRLAVLERLARDSPGRRPLAKRLAAAPELDGWFSPLDRSRPQLWSSFNELIEPPGRETDRATAGPMSSWEGYAHKPDPSILTSTPFGDDLSSLVIATATGRNDLYIPQDGPIRRHLLRVRTDARVYEVTGPAAWAALARAYPFIARQGHHTIEGPDGTGHYPDVEVLVPDWPAVARDWDGIRISLGSLLLSTEVPIDDAVGRSAFWDSESEGTYWFRWVFDAETVVPEAIPERVRSALSAQRIISPPSLWPPDLFAGNGPEATRLRKASGVGRTLRSRPGRSSNGGFNRLSRTIRRCLP